MIFTQGNALVLIRLEALVEVFKHHNRRNYSNSVILMLLPVNLVASINSKHKQLPLLVLSGEDGKEYVGCCDSLLVASYVVEGAGMIAWCHLHVLLLDSRLQVPLHGTEQTLELTPLPK